MLSIEATIITGISFVDRKITFVGKLTYLADADLQTFEKDTTRLRTKYGEILVMVVGRFFSVLPFEIATGKKKQKLNWNRVIAYGNAKRSGKAF
jgi:hypothetical protein